MSLDLSKLETLTPSQFITFTIPIPTIINHLNTPLLRIAVLDSPLSTTTINHSPLIAAMIVPKHRESDWTFCTESGHLQLLFNCSSNISRLILIGNNLSPNSESIYIRAPVDKEKLENELKSLVIALHPKMCFQNDLPKPLFLTYEDDVECRVIIDRFVGSFVGEFVVEDVELDSNGDTNTEFRRRLRFKRMPNLIQSQVPLIASCGDNGEITTGFGLESLRKMKEVEFCVDTSVLVHVYLTPMVSGIFLIGSVLDERIKLGVTPRALCLGVGGGALLSFLNAQLGFEVVGVEVDEVVLSVARKYFGLNDGKSLQLIVGDAIELVEKAVDIEILNAKFDVVMVDLDSSEARSGISAPPSEFVRNHVFQAMRLVLHDHGVLVINVIPPNKLFYESLIQELQDVFHKVYEIDVDNDGNFVLVATLSPITSNDHDNAFLKRLRSVISGSYMDSIVEL